MSLPVVCCLSCALVCALGTVECWGGRQGGCGPELCVRRLRVCGSQLAVCLVSLFVSVCRSRACRHHLSSVHPYRVGVQSEPGCSSPFYLTCGVPVLVPVSKARADKMALAAGGRVQGARKKNIHAEKIERFLAIPNNSNTHTSLVF